MFSFFLISILSSFGISVLLVEKGDDWPVSKISSFLRKYLSLIHPKFSEMLDCSVCSSFWASFITDLFLFIITGGNYFMWPLTGFAVSGSTWLIYEILSILDKNGE